MPDFVKIFILILSTIVSYATGVALRIKNYEKIGESLLILGALLYTLSIFLIAQIFNLSLSLQTNAWLWLLAFIGVFATAYLFNSSPNLVIGLAWFLIWIRIQYWAFSIDSSSGFESLAVLVPFAGAIFNEGKSFGLLILLYLSIAILLYGASLLHQSKNHKFAKVYRWWTAFYILVFTYILSFQMLLPMIWPSGFSAPTASVIFLALFTLISITVFFGGVTFAINSKNIQNKEIVAFIGITLLLSIIIFSAGMVSNILGSCSLKSCYDLDSENKCENINLPIECSWNENIGMVETRTNEARSGRCEELRCYSIQDETACNNINTNQIKCTWNENECDNANCDDLTTQNTCESADLPDQICSWESTTNYIGTGNIPPPEIGLCKVTRCHEPQDKTSCENLPAKAECEWKDQHCQTKIQIEQENAREKCNNNNNQRESCLSKDTCNWRPNYNHSFKDIPFKLWVIWIIDNIIFILIILIVIGYGILHGSTKIVNLGISFFVLDIITRYIGFMLDFGGQMGFAVMSIIGGGILILGGFFIERFRRKLIKEAKGHQYGTRPQ